MCTGVRGQCVCILDMMQFCFAVDGAWWDVSAVILLRGSLHLH
jgi:hypothetical protein